MSCSFVPSREALDKLKKSLSYVESLSLKLFLESCTILNVSVRWEGIMSHVLHYTSVEEINGHGRNVSGSKHIFCGTISFEVVQSAAQWSFSQMLETLIFSCKQISVVAYIYIPDIEK